MSVIPASVTETPVPRPGPGASVGALAGVLAGAVALGVAQLVSGGLRGATSPVVAVGDWVVDHAPPWLKDYAIRTFGENDKRALVVGTVSILAVIAVAIGIVAVRHLRAGALGIGLFGVVGVLAAMSRPGHGLVRTVPSVAGALAGALALIAVLRAAHGEKIVAGPRRRPRSDLAGRTARRDRTSAVVASPSDRRRFLVAAGVAGGAAVVSGGVGTVLRRRFSVAADRAAVSLPVPRERAAALPADAAIAETAGIGPFTTPNASFYRVDTALVVPQVSVGDWELRVRGMVHRPLRLSYDELLGRPMIERDLTLVCVSNEVGGHYAGTARWQGVRLADVLREAGVRSGADQLVSRSADGFTAGTPVAEVLDGRDALIAVAMNGEPLPTQHGFPARLVVPGLYGYVSATKWLVDLELTTFAAYDAYWVRRGWAQKAPIKTLSRIDTPRGLATLSAGPVPIAGVAWAPHRGISAVEVRIDDGPWTAARLGGAPSRDTWRQWLLPWEATPGRHQITVRARDGAGALQTEERAEPIPDGASGWHSIVVIVR